MKKFFTFFILTNILFAITAIYAQTNHRQAISTSAKQENIKGSIYFQAAKETDGTFATTVYTFDNITVFSYFDNTTVSIYNSTGALQETRTLNLDTYYNFNFGSGVFRIVGNKTYTVLVGDAITSQVNGYFAVDEAGRAVSTKLNTWMSTSWGGADNDFIVFAYNDNTGFTVKNLETGALLAAGTLNTGQHYSFKDAGNIPFGTPLQVSGTKPISALSYEDQDYYVPSSNGTFVGNLFYGFSAYNGAWTNSVTVTSYSDNNNVVITNTATGASLGSATLQTGQVYSIGITTPTFWTVTTTGNVSVANIPFYGWSGDYWYMTRAIDQSGRGFGTLFYIPTIRSSIHVFSFEAGNNVTITKLGVYENYPYTSTEVVWTGTLNEGEYNTFTSEYGRYVYKVESTKNVSVLQSNAGAGADFMPLAYSLDYPDLSISTGDIAYSKPDTEINAGDLITVTVTVHNYGSVTATNVNCVAYEGDPDAGGNAPPIGSGFIPSIAVGGSETFDFSYRVPTSPEYRFIVVKADPANQIVESNESNNKGIRSIKPNNELLPPLAVYVTAPSSLSLVGGNLSPNPFTVQFDIFNTGTVAAGNVVVTLELFNGLTLASGTFIQNLGDIAGSTTKTATYQISATSIFSGFNLYRATITASNADTKIITRSVNVPDATAPSVPSNFNGQTSGAGCATFTWNNNSENDLAGYYLYYSTDGINWNGTGATQGDSPILILGTNTTEICGFTSGTYHFMLRAFDTSNNLSGNSSVVQLNFSGQVTTETIFYGDNAHIYTVQAPQTGYAFGTNSYDDNGKYQRFNITNQGKLKEVDIYFGAKVVNGSADNFDLVVRGINLDGSPSSTLYSGTYSTNIIDISNTGVVYNTFTIDPMLDITSNFFAGIEWNNSIDDVFGIISDGDGEGAGAQRSWERWSDNTFHSIQSSWGLDLDLWISVVIQLTTDVEEYEESIPNNYFLSQNYPNPFNPTTSIYYEIPIRSFVSLKIYDLLGKEVAVLSNSEHEAGKYQVIFNASNLASGVYFYRLEAGSFNQTKKLILMK
ncbi:MAG: CARDB domain-containing protein [Bacteroidota bacterium]